MVKLTRQQWRLAYRIARLFRYHFGHSYEQARRQVGVPLAMAVLDNRDYGDKIHEEIPAQY